MNIEVIIGISYVLGMIAYIILDKTEKYSNHKTLDISDKIKKYKQIQNKMNEQCKSNGWFK